MNPILRRIVFFIGALGLAAMYLLAFVHLPDAGQWRDRYLAAINSRCVPERHLTDAVSAVNFDYRGIDTLGEEFILFVSVVGATVLLRQPDEIARGLKKDAVHAGRDVGLSDGGRFWIFVSLGPKLMLGIYIVTHGQLTPGGGFQGGVVLSSAALILYLGEGFLRFKKVVPHRLIEWTEAAAVGTFVLIGLAGMILGDAFLQNVLPLGEKGTLTSGGTVPLISAATGLEVAAGFTLLLFGFLQEMLLSDREKHA